MPKNILPHGLHKTCWLLLLTVLLFLVTLSAPFALLPAGVFTGLMGAPWLIWLVARGDTQERPA